MTNYVNAGTASVTNGTKTITFADVSLALIQPGDLFQQGGASGIIDSVNAGAGTAQLVDNWGGTTSSADPYTVMTIPEDTEMANKVRTILDNLAGPILTIAAMTGDDAPSNGEFLVWQDGDWNTEGSTGDDEVVRKTSPTVTTPTLSETTTFSSATNSKNLALLTSPVTPSMTIRRSGATTAASGRVIFDAEGGGDTYEFGVNSVVAAGIEFNQNTTNLAYLTASLFRPGADNAVTNGDASHRWSTVYAGTGSINTSDEDEKKWRGALSDNEIAAGAAIFAEIGGFQFLDAIAAKGEESARMHFGVRAQKVRDILEAHSLSPLAYAFLCFDEWAETPTRPAIPPVEAVAEVRDPQTGAIITAAVEAQPGRPEIPGNPAGSRWGIRPDELAYFLLAVLDRRLATLEAA